MSSKAIRVVLIIFGWVSLISFVIYGTITGSNMAQWREDEALYGFIGFIIGSIIGFGSLLTYCAIGNMLRDLERNADATEMILFEIRRYRYQTTDAPKEESQEKRVSRTSSYSEKLKRLNNDQDKTNFDNWICKKCGRTNLNSDISCKDCGAYK